MARVRDKNLNRISRTELFTRVRDLGITSYRALLREFRIDSTAESDRPRLWSLGQGLAELARDGHVKASPDRILIWNLSE